MRILKCRQLIILSTFIVFLSCKKGKNIKTTENPPSPTAETYTYVPVKFETHSAAVLLKYKENTAQLIEITDTDGNRTAITYTTDEQLFKLEKYKNTTLLHVVYYEQPDKKTTSKAQTFKYDPLTRNFTPLNSYSLTYNEQQKINTIAYYDKNVNLTNTYNLGYAASGNLAKITETSPSGASNLTSYLFDEKRGISSHINYSGLFTFESEHWFLFCSVNNILSITDQKSPQENVNFKYAYNENGYPSTVMITKTGNTQNVKITYQQVKD